MYTIKHHKHRIGIAAAVALLIVHGAAQAAMTSGSYKIVTDSVNTGGVDTSVSAHYKSIDTVGEVATGYGNSTSYKIHAGYRQMPNNSISINTTPTSVLPSLGLTTSSATSSATITVTTDAAAGYILSVNATSSNALVSSNGYSFADYAESVAGTPEVWNITNAYVFGFSVFGSDAEGKYGTAQACDTASANKKWEGLSMAQVLIAESSSATTSGTDTTLCFATEQDGVFAPSGTYTATIIATAVTK